MQVNNFWMAPCLISCFTVRLLYETFSNWKRQEKNKKVIACGYHKKKSHICSYIDFCHKVLHDFEVKNPISDIERIELSVKFKLFQRCHEIFTGLCLSLDWKIRFNLDFILKSFRCSKRDVWRVLLKIVQNCRRKKLGDEVTDNWRKVEDMENELDCDSND